MKRTSRDDLEIVEVGPIQIVFQFNRADSESGKWVSSFQVYCKGEEKEIVVAQGYDEQRDKEFLLKDVFWDFLKDAIEKKQRK